MKYDIVQGRSGDYMGPLSYTPGACEAFRQGGGGSRGNILKNMGVPGACPRKSLGNLKNLQLKGWSGPL